MLFYFSFFFCFSNRSLATASTNIILYTLLYMVSFILFLFSSFFPLYFFHYLLYYLLSFFLSLPSQFLFPIFAVSIISFLFFSHLFFSLPFSLSSKFYFLHAFYHYSCLRLPCLFHTSSYSIAFFSFQS